jgi:hypothetical protein
MRRPTDGRHEHHPARRRLLGHLPPVARVRAVRGGRRGEVRVRAVEAPHLKRRPVARVGTFRSRYFAVKTRFK